MQEGTLNIVGSVFQVLNAHLSHTSNFTGSVKLSRCELADISAFSLIRTTPAWKTKYLSGDILYFCFDQMKRVKRKSAACWPVSEYSHSPICSYWNPDK